MANWNNPLLTSLYTDFLTEVKARDVDALTMNPGTNIPVNSKRWEPTVGVFQNWNGSAWINLVLSTVGGGTGVSSGLPTLGTMASQNSNAVAITGGTITGVALNADAITAGIVALARGGTGASLALAGSGAFLQSNGAQVVFGTNGAALANLNVSSVNAGNLPIAHMPVGGDWNIAPVGWVRVNGSFISGAGLSNMGPGTVNAAAYYLNNAPFTITPVDPIPSGLMAYFSGACPAGWTFVSGSQSRTVRSSSGATGQQGGADTHNHGFNVPAGGGGSTNSGPANGEDSGFAGMAGGQNRSFDAGSSFSGFLPASNDNFTHKHTIGHTHQFDVPGFPGHNGATDPADSWPPFIEFSLCRKN